ncbi:MAG: hypothetical protein K9I59_00720 [Chlorobium sp.]|uniref:hypothetical protein n=1 Tax=Chlorobium sp. TaxID=1095 RepID=UPI0025C6F066|nr:hypothetical protein [Chlorobium sp.]MCF8215376.1 hypothetical protein [Chlorobium sp.]MCF8270214.1 hypothetical protein [Chlorobium sp.]MCF8286583.1 hypothetical protein [Chlorobium sp.]MCF8290182.1 hypothetical protein [Chlorobium sp.]MCF8384341.1 hypothetical protein [Chlorobium sp.]
MTRRYIDAVRNGEKGFYIRNSLFFPFHFELLSIWIGKEMSLLSSPEMITDISDKGLLSVREAESYTNIVFRRWGDLGRELGHHKGHVILHAAEKGADIFNPENLHYIKACFRDTTAFREVVFELIDDPFSL